MITFFVSSTFRDMHDERDCMHQDVVPALMNEAFRYGEAIAIRDLRWGVNTADEKSADEADKKVMSVCLKEIDRCRPYMIVLLGDRYGYVPGNKVIEEAIKEIKTEFSLSGESKETDISVTELEIQYGAFWRKQQSAEPKIICYLRDFEGSEVPPGFQTENGNVGQKLSDLKRRMEVLEKDDNQKNIIVRHYPVKWNEEKKALDGMEFFVSRMIEDVRMLMQEEWQSSLSMTPFQREKKHHREYARLKADQFTGRSEMVNDIFERLNKGQNLIILQGETGNGKSALMSHLAVELEKKNEKTKVLSLFCGYTPLTCRGLDIIRQMVEFIEENSEPETLEDRGLHDETDWREWRACLERRIENFSAGKKKNAEKLVILLDAADQMNQDMIKDHLLFIPGKLFGDVQMIISCVKEFPLQLNEFCVIPVDSLNGIQEKEKIVREMFRKEGKEVYEKVLDKILKKQKADNPLYLSLLVRRLCMMEKRDFQNVEAVGDGDYNSSMERYQNEILENCPDELEKMCVNILEEASGITGWKAAKRAIRYLAVSRYGLRETDLEKIFHLEEQSWSSLDFSRFCGYMNSLFIIREDGRYDFSHRSIREGYREWTLNEEGGTEQVRQLHTTILKHLMNNLKENDPVRMNEMIYHCYHGDDKKAFIRYICSIQEEKQEECRETAAREVHRLCSGRDKRTWLYSALLECNPWKQPEETEKVLRFVYHFLVPVFENSLSELEAEKEICTICLGMAEKLDRELESGDSRRLLADACYSLGNVCHRLGGTENYSRALNLYLRERELTDSIPEAEKSEEIRRRQMNSLCHLGDIYASMNGRENQNRALRLYIKNKEMSEIQSRSGCRTDTEWMYQKTCQRIGDILGTRDWESRKQALSLFDKAIDIVNVKKMQNSSVCQKELMGIYVRKGDLCMELGGEGRRQEAFRLYKDAEKIAEELKNEPLWEENQCNWLICCDRTDFAQVLMKKTLTKEWEGRYEDYRKTLICLEEKMGTAFIRRLHAVFLEHEGSLCMKKPFSEDSFRKAEACFRDAKVIFEELYKIEGENSYKRDLCVVYSRLGDLFMQYDHMLTDGRAVEENALEYYKKAYECYEKAYDYADELKRCSGTVENRADYMVLSRKLGEWYCAHGKEEEQDKSHRYYLQSIEEAIALEKELQTPGSMMDVAFLFGRIAAMGKSSPAGTCILERSELFVKKAKNVVKDISYEDCSLELHCRAVRPEVS